MANEITTFTPEEIRELEMSPSEAIREKIAATGNEEAVAAFDSYVALFHGVHDGYLMQANTAECALFKEVDPDKYKEYMYGYFYNANAPLMEGYWEKSFKERAFQAINGPRTFHDCRMKLLGEDDKKIWFVMDPCGAGQKLWEAGMCKDGCVADPHPITAGGKNFPVYCVHAPLAEIVANDLNTCYVYQQDYPEQVGSCCCVFNVYKHKEDIPQSYFDRINRKRPE